MRKTSRREVLQIAGAALAARHGQSQPRPGSSPLTLWFREPAQVWTEALPVGNGNLGAMVFGGVAQERLQLNEHSLWTGHPVEADSPDSRDVIAQMRKLLLEGKYAEANATGRAWRPAQPLGPRRPSYQTLGDLLLDFHHAAPAQDYRRELDLDTGIARTEYSIDGVRYTREVFASHPAQAIVVRIRAARPASIALTAQLRREADAKCEAAGPNRLVLRGRAAEEGVRFECLLEIRTEGGQVKPAADGLSVAGADSVTLLITAATDFRLRPSAPKEARALEVAATPYDALRTAHIASHRRLFRRVDLALGGSDRSATPTNERLTAVQQGGDDPQLLVLYFQYGRYLLMSSSRPGTLPANLQGLWAEGLTPPWQADYHVNINIQMNYWPAEVCNLSECHEPLFDFIDMLRVQGRRTAQVSYGCRGWVAHYTTDLWGRTALESLTAYAMWQGASGWLAQHLWEHYAFHGDREFLRARAWPVMKEAAEFYLDYMVEDPRTGKLVAGPSESPENKYFAPDGTRCDIDIAPAMSQEIVHDLLTHVVQAAEILAIEPEFREKAAAARARLTPLMIGKHGQIQEWSQDFDEPEPGHRHMSQLFALHPGSQVTLHGTPELAAAAKKTLERRLANGGGHTGWSRAWIINFWARLEEAELAHENVMALLRKSTLSNLFDTHPPFQIDGNFGGTAGIAEMLLQSHADEVVLLPALPKAWPEGRFQGLRARGGLEVAISWRGGKPVSATLEASIAGTHKIRTPRGMRIVEARSGSARLPLRPSDDGAASIALKAGQVCRLTFA
ncbi:MAG TPA: glycoside hydrolase family 95 protein [Bryobacteraceae bacterium]